ncbi:MAG: glycosyltransferase [Flavobacterium sp.]|nr:MAG: glycosyltransferase [Flavobacterium sp.]
MRIVQVIDSLETGGAERMAVSYANALERRTGFGGLVATRAEGGLKNALSRNVKYLFLKRRGTIDIAAGMRLSKFCRHNQVNIIHAHSSSWFVSVLAKLFNPKIKILWHDHYGMSEYLERRSSLALKLGSYFFAGIITVNENLAEWAIKKLKCRNVLWVPNFASADGDSEPITKLEGATGNRILCLANLRPQKNQELLLQVASRLRESFPQWTIHFVGKDFADEYSTKIKAEVAALDAGKNVFFYGSRKDTHNIIAQSEICVLASISEGLPVALLEYGMQGKPVVATAVGEIPSIIENGENGLLVHSGNETDFFAALVRLIENPPLRVTMGAKLKHVVEEKFSENAAMKQYLDFLETI